MERVWGGRLLETQYRKTLPPGAPIGEAWEIVDRDDAQSVVREGALQGATLHELWRDRRAEIFGSGLGDSMRFPLLFKLLDAQDKLSVQVHPPADVAARLGGEPKTEMWYFLGTTPGSDLFAGLKRGVTRAAFEHALVGGHIADLLHRRPSHAGEAFFIPTGRVHAIGAGNVIFEVQQNSDTTYRVFDWNRTGLDGQPRQLHIAESLESINFDDPEPEVAAPHGELVVECEFFRVEKWTLTAPRASEGGSFAVFAVEQGTVNCGGRVFGAGDFFLVPAGISMDLVPLGQATVLRTTIPQQS
jgi:mannose-6-phosphate isomerase